MITEIMNNGKFDEIVNWFLKIATLVLSLFYDVRIVLHAVLFLIVMDQVMGITYAIHNNEFSWRKFKKVFPKVIMYISAILVAFIYERYLLNSTPIYFTKIIAALVGAKEVSSSYIKLSKMTGIKVFETLWEKMK